jgi:hypothetical protein
LTRDTLERHLYLVSVLIGTGANGREVTRMIWSDQPDVVQLRKSLGQAPERYPIVRIESLERSVRMASEPTLGSLKLARGPIAAPKGP